MYDGFFLYFEVEYKKYYKIMEKIKVWGKGWGSGDIL